jgi:hypothetical protein
MIQVAYILKWALDHWKELTLGALLVGLLWLVDDWRDRGREVKAWREAAAGVRLERDAWREAASTCTKATRELRKRADAFELRLALELEREPELVTVYRERATALEAVDETQPCTEAVRQVGELLAGVTPP